MILEYAAALAGLTLVTANPAYQPRELKFVLEQSRSAGLFLTPEYRGNPMAEIAAEVAAGIPALREVVDLADDAALFARGPATSRSPRSSPTTRRRSSTPRAPPASQRARCCTTGA